MSNTEQTQPQSQPQYQGGANHNQLDPSAGRGISIAGFILAFLGPLALIGLILSIVGLIQSRKGGKANGFAIAGIVISIIALAIIGFFAFGIVQTIQQCQELGPGTHQVSENVTVYSETISSSQPRPHGR